MSDLTPSGKGRLSRSAREGRAYNLVLLGTGAAVAAVVFFVLALVSGFSFGWFFLALIIAAVAGFLFQRTTGSR